MKPKMSIVIPVLNEGGRLIESLQSLQRLRTDCELLVVDGGSSDDSLSLATPLADKILSAPRGRAKQMNAGAAEATGDILLFLHADTSLPEGAIPTISNAIQLGYHWGRFDVSFDSNQTIFKLIALMMNSRQ